ncbi:MAG: hypothetical protein AUG84_00735 [Chloroflexi bacterium 13_1_20CM_4_66_7]|nr:MAG: hypothetical protein AUG84_00735 [Chloroflexi bacterium 13_1_20CM_4_66_7]
MTRRAAAGLAICLAVGACSSTPSGGNASPSRTSSPSPPISTEWTEYHHDAGRSGAGPAEPALQSPHIAWSASVDAAIYASPLIAGGHVIVATENNTVYSLDLFTGSKVWERHLGQPVDAATLPCGNISPITGITGTPAVDPASGRAYVVAFLKGYHHVLSALSLTDGSVVWQQTIDPVGSTPSAQQLRGALAIGSGMVYVPFGGLFGDCGNYRGYVVGVPLGGGVAHAFVVPAARGASIWAPQGASVASDGSVYVVTGNALTAGFGYSDSVLQLSPDLGSVKSYFAPSNWQALNAGDTDLGSTGAALLPSIDRVFVIGKEGIGYLLRMGALGGIGGQEASLHVCAGAWGGTARLGSMVFVPCSDGLYAVSVSATSMQVAWHVGRPALAPPVTAAGALWAIDASSGTLYAFEPATGKSVFSTNIRAANRYSTPAATEGFVVAPSGNKVVAVSVSG